jgi:hypothetical protein
MRTWGVRGRIPMKKFAVAAVIASGLAASLASTSTATAASGCNRWGGICQDPNTTPAPTHTCPDFTDRHMRNIDGSPLYDSATGYYDGYVKIRSSISCARRWSSGACREA